MGFAVETFGKPQIHAGGKLIVAGGKGSEVRRRLVLVEDSATYAKAPLGEKAIELAEPASAIGPYYACRGEKT